LMVCLPACLAPPFFAPMPPGSHLAALRGPNYSMLLYLLLSAALLEDRQTGHHELFLHTINDEMRERERVSLGFFTTVCVCVLCGLEWLCTLPMPPFPSLDGPCRPVLATKSQGSRVHKRELVSHLLTCTCLTATIHPPSQALSHPPRPLVLPPGASSET
jgi:hypothetical protein